MKLHWRMVAPDLASDNQKYAIRDDRLNTFPFTLRIPDVLQADVAGDSIEEVIDFRRCPDDRPLSLFVYNDDHPITSVLANSEYSTSNASAACIFVAALKEGECPSTLKHWKGGKNHLIITGNESPTLAGNAIFVRSSYGMSFHRQKLDMIGVSIGLEGRRDDYWKNRVAIYAKREHLQCIISSEEMEGEGHFNQSNNPMKYSKVQLMNCEEENTSCVDLMKTCTFVTVTATEDMPRRILDALRAGAIPVVTSVSASMPFEDIIDWSKIIVRIPLARMETALIKLRSFSEVEVIEKRRCGRNALDDYLDDANGFARALVEVMSHRLLLPLREASIVRSQPLYGESYLPKEGVTVAEGLIRNRTPRLTWSKLSLDIPPIQENFPFLPPPDEMPWTLFGTIDNWRTEEAFRSRLGGSFPYEEFTILLLTFNRDATLRQILRDLNGLKYLNKVIVIWNDRSRIPSVNWPKIHVDVEFILTTHNSLNNRFIPWDRIETDAVLSMDDDIFATHSEIELAFRVWREHRSRIVGFPARRHADEKYDFGRRCDHTMVMTGFAFLHRMYLFEYTFRLPTSVRQHVEKEQNCEDIAMNFLVAHLTRKSPIKVASKITYEYPHYTSGLHTSSAHFGKRDLCIRYFTQVFGYNPLIMSQYSAFSANYGAVKGPTCLKNI